MSSLIVRQLLVDWHEPIPRHWYGGDAFCTAVMNVLSVAFPVGEQFFIESVREGLEALGAADRERFQAEIQAFIAQEAIHRRMHGLFNEKLERQGLIDSRDPPVLQQHQKILDDGDVGHRLAITAAYEHFSTVISSWQLRHPEAIGEEDARIKVLWLWHASEECEHRATAFDLYHAVGGDYSTRIKWFHRITFFLLLNMVRLTLRNLRRDRTLWRWSTWASAVRILLGPGGLLREAVPEWFAYKRFDFHPGQRKSEAAVAWFANNSDKYRVVKK